MPIFAWYYLTYCHETDSIYHLFVDCLSDLGAN